jgi:hypothetical protein
MPCDCIAGDWTLQYYNKTVAQVPSGELVQFQLYNYITSATLFSITAALNGGANSRFTGTINTALNKGDAMTLIVTFPAMVTPPAATAFSFVLYCY